MATEQARKFLEGLETNERARELLKGRAAAEAEAPGVYAQVARAVGFDVTAEELSAAMEELRCERAAENDAVAGGIRELTEGDMDQVAGGFHLYPGVCESTFKDMESCWFTDKCDLVINSYDFNGDGAARCAKTVTSQDWYKSCLSNLDGWV